MNDLNEHVKWLYNRKEYKNRYGNKMLDEDICKQIKIYFDKYLIGKNYIKRYDRIGIIFRFIDANVKDWIETYEKIKHLYNSTLEFYTTIYGKDVGEKLYIEGCKKRTAHFDRSSETQSKRGKLAAKYKKEHPETNTCRIEYYLAKGYDEKEAKALLKERQSTFTLKKCIKKYGKLEGKKRWLNRQEKWLNSFYDKTIEELEDIRKRQMSNFKHYSIVSQEFFDKVYEGIKHKYSNVYYGTHYRNDIKNNGYTRENSYEYYISAKGYFDEVKIKGVFLDFYIPDLNKAIEYDGDYWHSRSDIFERDIEREKLLKLKEINALHIKDSEYNKNKNETVKKCIDWILND